jgi:cell wall-associated NlpC family hydrolase
MQNLSLILFALLFSSPLIWAEETTDASDAGATISGADNDSNDRSQELVFHALAFLGVKYRFGGSDPQTGWDCSGYVFHIFRNAIGVTLPRNSFAMSERGESIERGDLRPGDLVFFNTLRRAFSHVGIYLGENRFIHAPSSGKAVQISAMDAGYWAQRFNGGRRVIAAK